MVYLPFFFPSFLQCWQRDLTRQLQLDLTRHLPQSVQWPSNDVSSLIASTAHHDNGSENQIIARQPEESQKQQHRRIREAEHSASQSSPTPSARVPCDVRGLSPHAARDVTIGRVPETRRCEWLKSKLSRSIEQGSARRSACRSVEVRCWRDGKREMHDSCRGGLNYPALDGACETYRSLM